jgi:hypothetical protein
MILKPEDIDPANAAICHVLKTVIAILKSLDEVIATDHVKAALLIVE